MRETLLILSLLYRPFWRHFAMLVVTAMCGVAYLGSQVVALRPAAAVVSVAEPWRLPELSPALERRGFRVVGPGYVESPRHVDLALAGGEGHGTVEVRAVRISPLMLGGVLDTLRAGVAEASRLASLRLARETGAAPVVVEPLSVTRDASVPAAISAPPPEAVPLPGRKAGALMLIGIMVPLVTFVVGEGYIAARLRGRLETFVPTRVTPLRHGTALLVLAAGLGAVVSASAALTGALAFGWSEAPLARWALVLSLPPIFAVYASAIDLAIVQWLRSETAMVLASFAGKALCGLPLALPFLLDGLGTSARYVEPFRAMVLALGNQPVTGVEAAEAVAAGLALVGATLAAALLPLRTTRWIRMDE